MARFYGVIGYAETIETEPGYWEEQITERPYFGDLIQNIRNLQNSGGINDDINIANQISILADPYANQNFHAMRYVEFMGTRWKITNTRVEFPRLILTLGGEYNGNSLRATE